MKTQTAHRLDREAEARREAQSKAYCDIDGPLDEAQMFADLTMQWWHKLNEERGADRADSKGITLDERERRILGFALGEMWDRLTKINVLGGFEG